MISIIQEEKTWKTTLKRFDSYDFYHTYDYHVISKKDDEKPILVLFENNGQVLAIPFLMRSIPGTEFFDLTSVYGYAGPVCDNIKNNHDFALAFNRFLKEKNIVSIFSRLHPFIKGQEDVLKGLGQTPTIGKVVNIDLTSDLAQQRTQYSKSTKNRTNKCRKLCTIRKAKTDEDIDTFIDIYYENMDRLSASKDYYFSRNYFFDFMKCDDFETEILMVFHNEDDVAIAASMFVKTNSYVQFHLSGSRTSYLHLAPANVFLDEMRVLATNDGYDYFNLGGGLGGREDSLFDFKSSFSNDYRDFKVWKYIVNNEVYNELSKNKIGVDNESFFPLYRK
ncbi:peptidoglycan bridge formation glycyltransferase FemA/FemB family protein [Maribacter algicola]|uniref:Peptidoglycan bridge formation glycyltransferase FemA/FemB family protein n=1 Tax=Meishania litoralis TaxID=3434685 RepID=A0ACC7LN20_9FLAO